MQAASAVRPPADVMSTRFMLHGASISFSLIDLSKQYPAFATSSPRQRREIRQKVIKTALALHCEAAAETIEFCRAPHGKPELVGALGRRAAFSLSHTASYLALAVSKRPVEVGVDIEKIDRPIRRPEAFARRYFSAAEQQALLAFPAGDMAAAVLRFWVAKEAVVKWHGGGIASGLDRFTVSFAEGCAETAISLPPSIVAHPPEWPSTPKLKSIIPAADLYCVIAAGYWPLRKL